MARIDYPVFTVPWTKGSAASAFSAHLFPTVVSPLGMQALCSAMGTVLVYFSRAVVNDATLRTASRYQLSGSVPVNSVTVVSPTTIRLNCGDFVEGTAYTLHIDSGTAKALDSGTANESTTLNLIGVGPKGSTGSNFNTGLD